MSYLEATGRGTDPRELKNLIIHGHLDEDGNPDGVLVEKVFESEHHAPLEKHFGLEEGHELLAYLADCVGLDEHGNIAANEFAADDEEEYTDESSEEEAG